MLVLQGCIVLLLVSRLQHCARVWHLLLAVVTLGTAASSCVVLRLGLGKVLLDWSCSESLNYRNFIITEHLLCKQHQGIVLIYTCVMQRSQRLSCTSILVSTCCKVCLLLRLKALLDHLIQRSYRNRNTIIMQPLIGPRTLDSRHCRS